MVDDGLARDVPHALRAQARRGREVRVPGVDLEAEPQPRAALVAVVDRRERERPLLPVADHRDLGRLGGLAARLGRLLGTGVARDLRRERLLVAARAVDRHQLVAALEHPGGREPALDRADVRGRLVVAVGEQQPGDQHEGDDEVDHRPGEDHHDALPHRLAVVGPMGDLVRDLLVRVHPGDLHVAPERDRADAVGRLAPAPARRSSARRRARTSPPACRPPWRP